MPLLTHAAMICLHCFSVLLGRCSATTFHAARSFVGCWLGIALPGRLSILVTHPSLNRVEYPVLAYFVAIVPYLRRRPADSDLHMSPFISLVRIADIHIYELEPCRILGRRD